MSILRSADPASLHPFGPLVVIADEGAGDGTVGRRLDEVRAALGASGLSHTIDAVPTPDVRARARAAFVSGTRFVVAFGDDATVRAVVNGAFRDGATIVDRPVIGVIPAPSGCELARSFGLPDDATRAVSHLRGEGTYALDVLRVAVTNGHGERIVTYGHNMAQVGFRAAVAARGGSAARSRVRRFTAFWATYATWRPREVTIHVDTRTYELRAWDVLAANGQFADGAQRLSPRSYPGDGVLDVLAFVGPKADAYRMLPRIFMNGGHLPDPGVKELRAKIRVSVESERPLPVVLDGEPLGTTPATVQIVPQQLLLKL